MSEPVNSRPARESFAGPMVTVLLAAALWLMWSLRDVLMLVGFASVLAIALEPLVGLLERIRTPRGELPRPVAAALVMLLLVAVGAWALTIALPQLGRELSRFIEGAPGTLDRVLESIREYGESHGIAPYLGPLGVADSRESVEMVENWGVNALKSLGGQVGNLSALIALALIPLLSFYLLSEPEDVGESALEFVPEEARPRLSKVWEAIELALRSYIRGQSVVCAVMGTLVGVALMLIGLPVPALLGTVVGIAEVVPILGFWVAALAILLTGWSVSPGVALAGFIAYLVINQLVGLLITPRVMGRHLKMHPFIVTVSILGGATLLGAGGAILALPLAAAIQTVVSEFAKRPARARKKV